MSLVGPRPERPNFVHQFKDMIPNYMLRHRVPSGLTGWAQVRYTYGATYEDGLRKLIARLGNWGPRGSMTDMDLFAPVGLAYAAKAAPTRWPSPTAATRTAEAATHPLRPLATRPRRASCFGRGSGS